MGLDVFVERLEEVLGSGAQVIERAILERLCSRTEVEFRDLCYHEGREFVDCVKAVKAMLEQKKGEKSGGQATEIKGSNP